MTDLSGQPVLATDWVLFARERWGSGVLAYGKVVKVKDDSITVRTTDKYSPDGAPTKCAHAVTLRRPEAFRVVNAVSVPKVIRDVIAPDVQQDG